MIFTQLIKGEFINELFYMGDWYHSTVGISYTNRINQKREAFANLDTEYKRKDKNHNNK
jgi:hypothetical protein